MTPLDPQEARALFHTPIDELTVEQLRRRLTIVQGALDTTSMAVLVTDATGVVEFVNPAFTRLTGYTPADIVGRHTRVLKSGEQPPETYRELWGTITAGATWHGQLINRRKSGERYHEEVTITPLTYADGRCGYVGVKSDASHREALARLAARGDRLDLLGSLASSVAHDLANILTPVVNGGEYLRESVPLDAEGQAVVVDIADGAMRATQLVRQLLDFVRGGNGTRVRIDTTRLLDSYLHQLGRSLPHTVRFEPKVARALPALTIDTMQLYQVLLNLVVNAVDAMAGEGVLTCAAEPSLRDGLAFVQVTVSDTGTGIAPELLPRIFDPFFTTKKAGLGTGLGLPTVRRVVEAQGGKVAVATQLGRGTTFTLLFPAAAP